MAKKVKTPEELQASIDKKVARRKLFFGTFTKSLAFFLAIAMVYTLAAIAFTPATTVAGGQTAQTGTAGGDDDGGAIDLGGDDTQNPANGDDAQTPANGDDAQKPANGDDAQKPASDGAQTATASKADAVKALNDATAKAASAGYDWTRNAYYTKAIDVGNATAILNGAISRIAKGQTIDSVVGNFLDIKDKPMTATKAKGDPASTLPEDMKKEKFLLQAMTVTEGDVMQFKVSGNSYVFQLNNCNNPDKGNDNNPLNHATKDFVTQDEVVTGLKDAAKGIISLKSMDVDYTKILVKATIENGSLKKLEISYSMNVKKLELNLATGTGAGNIEMAYSNFVY